MLFITAQQLPSFITWDHDDASSPPHNRIRIRRRRVRGRSWWLRLPRLKPRQVPIAQWLLQVTTFASGTLLNNLVYAYSVPLTIQIVFRSAGK
jgi:UDP-xylose/UDP-N-acetylglucosamine transporter B4